MHDDIVLDDNLQDDKARYPPDRNSFQHDLSSSNAEIKIIKNKIKNLCLKCTSINGIIQAKITEKENLKEESRNQNQQRNKIKDTIDSKRTITLELERDCRIRNKETLHKMLSRLETRYKTKISLREEQALVTEIDAMRRNLTKLEMLETQIKRKRELERELETIKTSRQETFKKSILIKTAIANLKEEKYNYESEIQLLRENLKQSCDLRRELIVNYETNRTEYKQWLSEKKKDIGNMTPMSFPSVRKTNLFIEDEELEPFYEQKRDCKRLIRYLETFKIPDQSEPECEAKTIESDDDSADELPLQFQGKNSRMTPVTMPNAKRIMRKGNQPISHNLDIYNLFGAVDVDVPNLYSEVPVVLKEVKEKLEFYEQQTTNELDWSEEFAGLEYLSISRQRSEMDSSFCDDSISDITSISGHFLA